MNDEVFEHLKKLAKKHNLTMKEILARVILKEGLRVIEEDNDE